ncbi:hypothetical protein ARMA_3000 [Ardenticatena maritima]|uniref:Uncharacterized protein n=1 Tax=Ardenticatena maritima TaxID=872965 RepID=A0A0N0RFX8_9CHLR|nr:hypothetical protein ARMA_3000 [Ardenticatena maritima]
MLKENIGTEELGVRFGEPVWTRLPRICFEMEGEHVIALYRRFFRLTL